MSKGELLHNCQDLKTVFSCDNDCDADSYKLYGKMQVLSSVIPPHISGMQDMFKFTVLRRLNEVHRKDFTYGKKLRLFLLLLHMLKAAFRD
jgi:hypothetical protein